MLALNIAMAGVLCRRGHGLARDADRPVACDVIGPLVDLDLCLRGIKGWIERVFTQGWAYEEHADGTLVKKLGHLPVHLVALGGATLRTYARHGYFGAMRTQIEHGIFDYCGAPVASSTLLLASDDGYPDSALASARGIGRRIPEMIPSALSLPAPLLQRQQ